VGLAEEYLGDLEASRRPRATEASVGPVAHCGPATPPIGMQRSSIGDTFLAIEEYYGRGEALEHTQVRLREIAWASPTIA
jgi:hypothetical protein